MLKPPSGREIVMSKCPRCDAIGEMNRDDSYPPGTIWEPLSAGGGIHVPDREPCLRRQLALALEENKRLREVARKASQVAIVASDWNLPEVEIDGKMVRTNDLIDEFMAAASKPKKETK